MEADVPPYQTKENYAKNNWPLLKIYIFTLNQPNECIRLQHISYKHTLQARLKPKCSVLIHNINYSSLHWSFDCFLSRFCSTGVYSKYIINVYNMDFFTSTYGELTVNFSFVTLLLHTPKHYYV